MKKLTPNTSRVLPALAGLGLGLLAMNANAALQYWDPQGTTAIGGDGVWDATTPNWTPTGTQTQVDSPTTWVAGNAAVFCAGPSGSGNSGTVNVTVNGTVSIGGIFNGSMAPAPCVVVINAGTGGQLSLASGDCAFSNYGTAPAGTTTINCPITGGGRLNPQSSGALYLNANNTYSGGTLLNYGPLNYFSKSGAFGTGTITIARGSGSFATLLGQGGALLTLANNFANSTSGGGIHFAADANTPVTCTGTWSLGANNLNIRNSCATGPLTLSGVISGTAVLTLSANNDGATIVLSGANTYSGATALSAGGSGVIVKVSSLNSVTTPAQQASSSLGKPSSVANGTIAIGSGAYTSTLVYTGAGETTDRIINLAGTTGGATLQNDGSGALIFTPNFTATGANSKTLTLQGNNTGNNTIVGKIVDNSSVNKTAVVKSGAGTWVLGGANTYTGGTTVNQGTLVLTNAAALAASSTLTINSGATVNLDLSGQTNTINALVINGGTKASGVWGPVGSAAPNQDAAFQGNGYINVLGAPTITQQPVSGAVFAGNSFTFSVGIAGDTTGISYQWKHNGSNVGANNSSFAISAATLADAGGYSVVVNNSFGSATSATAYLTVATTNSYTAAILGDGPLSYWRLDETNGTIAYDLVGTSSGTYSGATLNQPGFASPLDSDPCIRAGYAETTNYAPFAFNSSKPMTLEGWVKFTSAPTAVQRLVSTLSSNPGWAFGVADNQTLRFTVGGKWDGSATTPSPMLPGVWYHLAITFNPNVGSAGAYTFYFNGQPISAANGGYQVATDTTGGIWSPQGASTDLAIGRNPVSGGFPAEAVTGYVDEVAIYGGGFGALPLSAAQIANHFANSSPFGVPPYTVAPVPNPATNYQTLSVTLQENALGRNLAYQWYKAPSQSLDGKTASALTLAPLQLADAGSYFVVVTNDWGASTSAAAAVYVLPLPATAADVHLTNGLVLHLPFDDDYKDTSGKKHNGTPVGAPVFTNNAMVGTKALHYSTDTSAHSTNYVTLGNVSDLKFGATTDFSISYWVRQPAGSIYTNLPFFTDSIGSSAGITNAGGGFCVSPYATNDTYGGGWMFAMGSATHSMTTPSQYTSFDDVNVINDGKWHHLVHVVQRTGNVTTYLDGTQVDSEPVSFITDSMNNNNPANIGQDAAGKYAVTAQADIDDLGVWQRMLSPLEVSGIYLAAASNNVSFAPIVYPAAPTIVLKDPTNNAAFSAPASFTLDATVVTNGNVITKVEYFYGTTKVGESTAAGFTFNVSGLAAGTYPLYAQLDYNDNYANHTVLSQTNTITVTALAAPTTVTWTQSAGQIHLSFSGGSASSWKLIGTSDLSMPVANWPVLQTAPGGSSGSFDIPIGTTGNMYFRLKGQ